MLSTTRPATLRRWAISSALAGSSSRSGEVSPVSCAGSIPNESRTSRADVSGDAPSESAFERWSFEPRRVEKPWGWELIWAHAEQYVGKVMAYRRNEAFLATKTKERTRDGSMRMIDKSLKLLQTDHVDLWQLHDIGTITDINEVFAKGGAMEALLEMQQQKVVKPRL